MTEYESYTGEGSHLYFMKLSGTERRQKGKIGSLWEKRRTWEKYRHTDGLGAREVVE